MSPNSLHTRPINQLHDQPLMEQHALPWGAGKVSLRRFPYPYRAALAICSDIDDTRTTDEFMEIQRFLNTTQITSMGQGIGLEIGNSFYFYDDDGYFSYFTHDDRARRMIVDLIHAGYIDCLHSYGDSAISRDQILRALEELQRADCKLDVWVNHNGASSNLGPKFAYLFNRNPCLGDDPSSSIYHADVTLDYGIRFAWIGAFTRVVGQSPAVGGRRSAFTTIVDQRHPLHSGASLAKEIRKSVLGQWGDARFTMHARNQLLQETRLGDGHKIHEFTRYCDHPAGVPYGGTSHGLARLISQRTLEHLKAVQGFMIVYTHFGQNDGSPHVIPSATQAALRHLAREHHEGAIYVTTTSRLLKYAHALQYLVWSQRSYAGGTQITIEYLDDPIIGRTFPTASQLQGLTFYVADCHRADVYLGDVRMNQIQRNLADESGMESVTIPVSHLNFPL
jgi:hypothetical protein